MNDKVLELINGVGAMAELWTISYNSFKKQGYSDDDAIVHTKAFMSVMTDVVLKLGGNQGGGSSNGS